ncbi:dTDP-4-dehydrorhamnose 3,5-epimerase [Algicella marina]|uniref:dTDP-4-dehydrorhamnose 3,5-epimerase n=1 Tax=Algicella marina TaxID=2683284 RepID=A0A6P1SYK4_9RHOB|nr:dTDP-4-dehydrorhamnose 3,5-epimerase [Algicella marina]QHQ34089.1 dTDP-4-dehydrorhamnose 3,5-epimerase [Algicella marina]
MEITPTALEGVMVLKPRRFGDQRGFFSETWNRRALGEAGLDIDFCQDNQSLSAQRGTVRGLHFQAPPVAQDKLVRCVRGRIMDVAVDIRCGSPTYGRWVAQELSAENGLQLLIPKGFLHGFATLTPDCDVLYKCSDYYAPETEGAVRFDDPDLAIDWGLEMKDTVLSAKDAEASAFADLDSPFTYQAVP